MSTAVRTFHDILHEIGVSGGVPADALDAPIRLASGEVKRFTDITHDDVRAEQDHMAAAIVALEAEADLLDQLNAADDLEGATALLRSTLSGHLERGDLDGLNRFLAEVFGEPTADTVIDMAAHGRLDEVADWIRSLTPPPGGAA